MIHGTFLLTPLREGRLEGLAAVIGTIQFLLTPLREGRLCRRSWNTSRAAFLLTPLREGRRSARHCPRSACIHFYSRPCGRGDPGQRGLMACVDPFLLTPLREGRHKWFLKEWRMRHISTHAPAGGATAKPGYGVQGHHISTHAPAGGATSPEDAASRSAPLFLLTPLREGRQIVYTVPDGADKKFLLTPLREGRLSTLMLA